MAINKAMKLALKALSYPDIDIKKVYKIERTFKSMKAVKLLKPLYKNLDRKIISDGREVTVRVYTPVERFDDHTLLFFHGGGWATENIDTYNKVCVNLAKNTGCQVVSVEYSLAPESPFPEGLMDCYSVAKEYFTKSAEFGTSPEKIILVGDSAGGNLAAAVSLMARNNRDFRVSRQILIYPAVGHDHDPETSPFDSVRENGFDYLLTSKRICEYMDLYASRPEDYNNPYFAPLLADSFENLPETLLITAEFDPLRDEGEEYGRKLEQAGVPVYSYRMEDGLHGYFSLDDIFEPVKKTNILIEKFIRGELEKCQRKENEVGEN